MKHNNDSQTACREACHFSSKSYFERQYSIIAAYDATLRTRVAYYEKELLGLGPRPLFS